MAVIINLRGTSGSGKTTVARTFMNLYASTVLHKTVVNPKGKARKVETGVVVETSELKDPLYLIGKYDPVQGCGGLDACGTQQNQAEMILKAYEFGNVLCEGLLLSSVGADATVPAALLNGVGKDRVIFAFLDTPLDLCLDRVKARRLTAKKPNEAPLNETNTRKKFEDVASARRRLIAAGAWVADIDHRYAFQQVLNLFKENE